MARKKEIVRKKLRIPSARAEDQPATRKMLYLIRDELIQRMETTHAETKATLHRMEASNSRTQLLVEEQNANNRIVLEGLQALWQRQDRIEERLG